MSIRRGAILLAGVLTLATVSDAFCGGDVLLLFGKRTLDSDAKPVEDQDVYGITAMFRKESWPVSLGLGAEISGSKGTGVDTIIGNFQGKGDLMEAYIGVDKVWENLGHMRPYVGGGASILAAQFTIKELTIDLERDDDDTIFAPYLNAGVFWRVGKGFNVGVGVRYLFFAEAVLFDQGVNVNYLQYNGLIGWGW